MRIRAILLFVTLIATVTLAQKKNSEAAAIASFDAWAAAGMKDWSMPGMAVAVVRDGKVLFMKGYGVKELGKDAQVDIHTVFSIGSTTKAMTAVCMGILVDEGKVSWDDPVIRHLPDLQLHDAYVTRTLRIRDLFTHNSGVGNADFLWGNFRLSQDEIVRKMAEVEPSYPLRGGFIYQNIFYLIAGKVIERVSGKPWSVFMKERIFTPLGMIHSVSHRSDTDPATLSSAHYKVDGQVVPIRRMSADAVDAAGSVYGCIDDISKWAIAMLDSGKYPGGRLLKPATWTELFRPQVIVPAAQMYPTMQLLQPSWTTYGLGWFQHDYKGRKINYHTGSLPGEIAMHAQLPSEKLGMVFMGNLDHAELRHALVYKAFDQFVLGGTRDWHRDFLTLYAGIAKRQQQAVDQVFNSRVRDTKATHELSAYAGTYQHPLHGIITISHKDGSLTADLNGSVRSTLTHFHYDTFEVRFEELWMGRDLVNFRTGLDGKVEGVESGGVLFKRK